MWTSNLALSAQIAPIKFSSKKTLFTFGLHFHKMKRIRNEKDYQAASKRLEKIFSSKLNTPDGNEAEILVILMEDYEKKHFPVKAPDSVYKKKKKK
jgi:hypothetical protein